ncbi:site-specific DNA-methyltransferase [Salicola sp. Rm-C-2C1-2]|uniref:site-specific DNA-methyltransferase n=1 Tax=Salicola sp. Rm-C-2C1-2 TaxID=3141321 RepID=UPI0032E45403
MADPQTEFNQLRAFLKDLFQFEDHELDFGIYRITRLKRQFIQNFIDGEDEHSLRATVERALSGVQNSRAKTASNWLAAFAAKFGDMGRPLWEAVEADPDDSEAVSQFKGLMDMPALAAGEREEAEKQLQAYVETHQQSQDQLAVKVYNHLLNFFELYYQNGDFGYNTRATTAFQVPYEADYDGADTLFHWKHKDSYYIKTGNGFHTVRFELGGKWVEFRLAGAEEGAETGERNNNRDDSIKHYRFVDITSVHETCADGTDTTVWQVHFVLATASTPKTELYPKIWGVLFGEGTELTPYLHKQPGNGEEQPGKPAFKDLTTDYDKAEGGQLKGISQLRLDFGKYTEELAKREEFKRRGSNSAARKESLQEDTTARALWELDKNLNRFYVGNDADYFIHKDLRGFLRREKERFIKQVIFADLGGLLHAGEDNATTLIGRAFNQVSDTLIDFLAAIEDFQKGLFEMKKKVVDTHYLISVSKIPEEFHDRVCNNADQLTEWRQVYGIEITDSRQLTDHPSLVVDTSLYTDSDPELQDDLLSHHTFENLDVQTDGLLIASENWQALNLLQEKFREQIQCIYIDPPYNTGGDGFLYKDAFRHSSWASMVHDRLEQAYPFLTDNGVLFSSIDDKERTSLDMLLRRVFGSGNRVEELIWAQNATKNQSPTYSTNHEYVEVFARDLERVKAEPNMFREPKPGYTDIMKLVERLNTEYPPLAEVEQALADLFEDHKSNFRAELEEQGIEFSQDLDPWKGLYNYKNAEYRDRDGNYIPEEEARDKGAIIWVWRESDPSMPAGKQSESTKDPSDPNYRFYRPVHKETGQECNMPKRGWAWPFAQHAGRLSFTQLDNDNRIAWGPNENKIPQVKRFLHESETSVGKSVVKDYTDGERELTELMGKVNSFPNPKPTTLIERLVTQTTVSGDWIMDFFAGSGPTGEAVLRSNQNRRFLLVEMGNYVETVLQPRIKRVMYSPNWKAGSPTTPSNRGFLIKVQHLEQYEDVLDNLEAIWDDAALPEKIPVHYLFRPECNALSTSLDLRQPFSQTIHVGKARQGRAIDLMETWCYLQGYWIYSRRIFRNLDRNYVAVETTHGTLVVFRNINNAEVDTDNLNALLDNYRNEHGVTRIRRLELNHEADLRRLPENIEAMLISAEDFLRGAQWS